MGLDAVELVLRVEEEFDLEIPDSAAEKITTVGQLHEYVLFQLREAGFSPDAGAVYDTLRFIISDQLQVKPEEVKPSARFVQDLGMN